MKRKNILLIFILGLFCFWPNVYADELIDIGGNYSSGIGSTNCSGDNSCWSSFGSGTTDAVRGFRLTLYKFENNRVTKVGESQDFINNEISYKYIKSHTGFKYIQAHSGKIDYKSGTSFVISTSTETTNFYNNLHYLPFDNYFGVDNVDREATKIIVDKYYNSKTDNPIKNFQNLIDEDNKDKYYLVLEPLTIVTYKFNTTQKIYFYGTSYEHSRAITQENWGYSNTKSVSKRALAVSAMIDQVKEENGSNFTGFLNAAGFKNNIANLDNDSDDKNKYRQLLYSHDAIMKKTFGMQIFWIYDMDPPVETSKEDCQTNIDINSCGKSEIEEPTVKECLIGQGNKYVLDTYKDSGIIYCSNSVETDFNNFYTSFDPEVFSGRYFPMNDLIIKNTKTCYIKSNGNSYNVLGWEKNIKENLNGQIKLTVGNRTYNLEEKIDSAEVKCESRSNGVCAKATLTSTFTYSLNPFTNRFISLETFQEDTVREQTDKNYDNGGPRLTVPLNYLSGTYNYKLDLSNSLLKTLLNRVPKEEEVNKDIDGISYELNYKTNRKTNSLDLLYSCKFKVKKDDDIPPTPPDDECECLGECCDDECNIIDCPITCDSECCDENDNPIPCPTKSFDFVIYRPINLQEPFPGQDGIGRDFGSNWYGNVYNAEGNTINKADGTPYTKVEYYIDENRGYSDYDVYRAEPLYVIKLDYEALSAIRKYNDLTNHDYNDFSLTCVNGENCISNFLRGNLPDFNINLISDGLCKSSTTANFNECTKRRGA